MPALESDCEEYQSCKTDSVEDSDIQAKEPRASPGLQSMSAFLTNLFEDVAERYPDKDERWIPRSFYPSQTSVYYAFVDHWNRLHEEQGYTSIPEPPSRTSMRRLWDQFFSDVKIKKSNTFAQCDICITLRTKMQLALGEHKAYYKRLLGDHQNQVRQDRMRYWGNRESAFLNINGCYHLSVIIDGMSCWKTQIPHFIRPNKEVCNAGQPLQQPLIAAKVHGLGNIAFWQHGGQLTGPGSGSNVTCSIILYILHEVKAKRGFLPQKLKLQMDNCGKDNKNITVIAFLASLLEAGIFTEVEVSSCAYSISFSTCVSPWLFCCSITLHAFTAFERAMQFCCAYVCS